MQLRHWRKNSRKTEYFVVNWLFGATGFTAIPAPVFKTDGFFQQHCLQAECTKSGLRSPNVLAASISSRKTAENGENRTCGNASVLWKLDFRFFRVIWSSWSKCHVASVERLYQRKWTSFREIGRLLFRVIFCKYVVCCNIWTGDTFYSDLLASRYRWNREALSSLTAVFSGPLWFTERVDDCFCCQGVENSAVSASHSRKLRDSYDHIIQVSD